MRLRCSGCLCARYCWRLPTPALAQQTGTLSGAVFDKGGSVVAGATITLTGDVMPAARTTVSSESGLYSVPAAAARQLHGHGRKDRRRQDRPAGRRLARPRHAGRRHPRIAGVRSRHGHRGRSAHRREVHGSELQLQARLHPGSAARSQLPGPDAADPRHRRQRRVCAERRRQPAGQRVPARRREHHESAVRLPRHGSQRARHRRRSPPSAARSPPRRAARRASSPTPSRGPAPTASPAAIASRRFRATGSRNRATACAAITDRWVNAFNFGGPMVKNRLFFYGSGRIFQSKATRAANVFGPLPDREGTDRTSSSARSRPRSRRHGAQRRLPAPADRRSTTQASAPTTLPPSARTAKARTAWST